MTIPCIHEPAPQVGLIRLESPHGACEHTMCARCLAAVHVVLAPKLESWADDPDDVMLPLDDDHHYELMKESA